jgi:hypothetical protein
MIKGEVLLMQADSIQRRFEQLPAKDSGRGSSGMESRVR